MKQFKKVNILIILLSSCFSACEKEVPLRSSEYSDKLVANSFFTQDTIIFVSIYRSRSVLDASYDFTVDESQVVIYGPDNFQEKLVYNPLNDKYQSAFIPVPGQKYRLQVSAKGFETMIADGFIPQPIKNLKFEYRDSVSYDSDGAFEGELTISFLDPPDEENYYFISLYFYWEQQSEFSVFAPDDAELLNPGLIRTRENNFRITDINFNGKNHTLKFKVPFGQISSASPKFALTIQNVSKDFYIYRQSVDLNDQTMQLGIFTEPVQIYTNFNTGLGIFAGAYTHKDTIY